MDEFLEKNSELRYTLWEYTVFGGILLLFLPGIIVFMIKYINIPLINVMVYLAGLSLLLDRLKEFRINLIYLLNESHKFLFRYKQIRDQIKIREGETENKEVTRNSLKNRTTILKMALLTICSSLLVVLVAKNFIQGVVLESFNLKSPLVFSPFFRISLLILAAVYLLNREVRDKVKQRIRYRKYLKCKSDIEVWVADENTKKLGDWIDETLRMCDLLNVKEVGIEIHDTGVKKVFSIVSNTHMPIIMIGKEVFEKSKRLYPQEHFKIIRMLIAHELVHIHYRDGKWMKKVYAVALVYIGIVICSLMIIVVNYNMVWGNVAVLLLLILDIVAFRILRDERYWKQVMEFRADRVGMAISYTTPDLLEKVLICTAENEEGDKKREKINIIQKIYQRKIEQLIHPSAEQRIYEAKRERPWGVGEYFRYLWMIIKNLFMGKGWRV